MSVSMFWILLLGALALSRAAPTVAPTISPDDQSQAEDYLYQFYSETGVSNVTDVRARNLRNFTKELESMQAFFGLEVTGSLNTETVEVMKAPRCGVPDVSKYGHFDGKPKWEKDLITYRITQYTPDLSQSEVDATIAQAFKLYSDVIPLNFKQIYSGTADIMILFKGGAHGDFQSFDGPGGVLAHAYSPGEGVGGDTHFDDDETWTLTQRDVNLLLVAAHEFGHALGLDHSQDKDALMYPIYQYVNTNGYQLPDDDRRGVQALYVSPTDQPYTTVDKCGTPPLVTDGEVYYSADNMFVRYMCNHLYKLKGNRKVWCLNGQWTRPPTCEVNFCTLDTSSHSELVNTRTVYIKSGEKVKLDCVSCKWRTALAKCIDNQLHLSECCLHVTHKLRHCAYSQVQQ